jgi:hypothetical protein
MLAALKESTEEKGLIDLATAYLRGRKGTLVRKKREKDAMLAKRQSGMGVGGPEPTSGQANDGGASMAFSGVSEQEESFSAPKRVKLNEEASTTSISGDGDAMQLD